MLIIESNILIKINSPFYCKNLILFILMYFTSINISHTVTQMTSIPPSWYLPISSFVCSQVIRFWSLRCLIIITNERNYFGIDFLFRSTWNSISIEIVLKFPVAQWHINILTARLSARLSELIAKWNEKFPFIFRFFLLSALFLSIAFCLHFAVKKFNLRKIRFSLWMTK